MVPFTGLCLLCTRTSSHWPNKWVTVLTFSVQNYIHSTASLIETLVPVLIRAIIKLGFGISGMHKTLQTQVKSFSSCLQPSLERGEKCHLRNVNHGIVGLVWVFSETAALHGFSHATTQDGLKNKKIHPLIGSPAGASINFIKLNKQLVVGCIMTIINGIISSSSVNKVHNSLGQKKASLHPHRCSTSRSAAFLSEEASRRSSCNHDPVCLLYMSSVFSSS